MESKKYDPFLDLSLDIPDNFDNDNSSDRNCNITDCLKSFTAVSRSGQCNTLLILIHIFLIIHLI